MRPSAKEPQLVASPREPREIIWYCLLPNDYQICSYDEIPYYPLLILRTCQLFNNEAKVALRKHFEECKLFFYERHPCGHPEEEADEDREEDDNEANFLEQYGECYKRIEIYAVEYSGDPLSFEQFPKLELLEFGMGYHLRVEKKAVAVTLLDNQPDDATAAILWSMFREKYEDDPGIMSEEHMRYMDMKKGEERGFHVHATMHVDIRAVGSWVSLDRVPCKIKQDS